jgi:hypothetical protein
VKKAVLALFAVPFLLPGTSLLSVSWDFNGTANLVSVDTNTLATSTIGPLGVPFQYGGLAYDSANATLYMVDGRGDQSLYTVNMATGAATLVGAHGLTDLFGITFDPTSDTLYASQFIADTPLEIMNISTGAATPVGTAMSLSDRIGALAFDTNNNTLYGLEDCINCASIFTVNRTTGVATLLNASNINTNNSGLVYDPSLDRLWDLDVTGQLSFFDPVTGGQTVVGSNGGHLSGLALVTGATVPEPGSLVLFGCGMVAIMVLRRYRRSTE